MKKFYKINVILLWIFIIYVVTLPISIPLVNNITASNVERKLKRTELPPNTEICDSISKAGKLTGCGNGMQFFGAILLESELSINELSNYYEKYSNNNWSYVVEPQTSQEISEVEHGSIEFEYLKGKDDFSSYYIVYTWGSSKYPLSDWDLRGH